MSKDEAGQYSEQYLKSLFVRLSNRLDQIEASNCNVTGRSYRRLLADLFAVDKELERRGIVWGY